MGRKKKQQATLPQTPQQTPQEAALTANALFVVDTQTNGKHYAVVTIESSNLPLLMSADSRKLAAAQGTSLGLKNAGVSAIGGTYVPPDELAAAGKEQRPVARWQQDFALTAI